MFRIVLKYLGIEVTPPVVYSLNQGTGTGFTIIDKISKTTGLNYNKLNI